MICTKINSCKRSEVKELYNLSSKITINKWREHRKQNSPSEESFQVETKSVNIKDISKS